MSAKRRTAEQKFARMKLSAFRRDPGPVERQVFDTWNLEFKRATDKGVATRSAQAHATEVTAKKFKTSTRNVQGKLAFWRLAVRAMDKQWVDVREALRPAGEALAALNAIFGDELHSFDPETNIADLYPLAACRAAKRITRLESENAQLRRALKAAQQGQEVAEQAARAAEIRAGAAEMARSRRN